MNHNGRQGVQALMLYGGPSIPDINNSKGGAPGKGVKCHEISGSRKGGRKKKRKEEEKGPQQTGLDKAFRKMRR